MATIRAAVAADCDHQRRGPPAQWFMGQLPSNGVTRDTLTTTPAKPLIRIEDPTRQHGTLGFEPLPNNFKT